MNIPNELSYTKSHEWVKFLNSGSVRVGITDFAQHALGDLVFINLPEAGGNVKKEESFADIESVKAVSDIYSPVTGEITAVNESLLDDPASINTNPYEAWFIEVSDITDKEQLLDAAAYESFCASEE